MNDRSIPFVGYRAQCIRFLILLVPLLAGPACAVADTPPAVGSLAPDFTLGAIDGQQITLSKFLERGPVVLVVLRGYPGYQCPICSVQVSDLLSKAQQFRDANARVVLVYPGPAPELVSKAKEFLGKRSMPEHVSLVVDPDYSFTNAYHLRWDAPRETAYPSAFVIDPQGKIKYSLVSKTHAGRAKAADLLKAIAD